MTTETLLLWDDNPSEIDLLGFDAIADPISQALLRERLDPVCVGVFGPWGCGKTTILRLIEQRFSDDSVVVVFTQPWSYDPATDPKATLVGEVLAAVRDRLEGDAGAKERLAEQLTSLAKRIRWSRGIKLAARTALTAQLPSVDDLESLFGEGDQVEDPTLQGFRGEFAELLSDTAFDGIQRVVVLVDDLDRCLPETVVDTLEAIKLFLSVPKMAFIVAADEAPVTHAIADRYGRTDEGLQLASKYLEKIVQIPVRVPTLGSVDVEAYVGQLLLRHRFADDDEGFEAVRSRCATLRESSATSLLDWILSENPEFTAEVALAARLAPFLYEEYAGNPRQIKRFLNAYWIRTSIARSRGVDFEVSAFAKLMILEEVYPSDFRTLLGWLSAGDLSVRLSELEEGEGEGQYTAQLSRWAALDPSLASLDISPYLLLAASLVGTTVSQDSLPTHLRDVASRLAAPQDVVRRGAQTEMKNLSIEDRALLVVHVADLIRFQPSHQANLAESLMTVIGQIPELMASAIPVLRRLPHSEITPALPITIHPPGSGLAETAELLAEWAAADDVPHDTRNAAQLALTKERT
jgi:KAP-like P-loop domain-containing protein